jgi:hypothetical protein
MNHKSSSSTAADNPASTSFLRRLVDMLSENEDVISFYAGSATTRKRQKTLGRIVVHDRITVEAKILPRYFNHSSFASLRRQLNYFSFTRIGKGRQRGAVYENEGVIVLDDILHLRRRSTVSAALGTDVNATSTECSSRRIGLKAPKVSDKKKRSVSTESLSPTSTPAAAKYLEKAPKKSRIRTMVEQTAHRPAVNPPTVVSPRTSPLHSPSTHYYQDEPKVILDLTVPPVNITPSSRHSHRYPPEQVTLPQATSNDDAEVLAGCEALLCFSQGLRSSLTV